MHSEFGCGSRDGRVRERGERRLQGLGPLLLKYMSGEDLGEVLGSNVGMISLSYLRWNYGSETE